METRGQTHMWPSKSSSSSIEVKTSVYMTGMCIPKANPSTYLITKYNIICLNPCLCKIKRKKGGPKRHGSPEGWIPCSQGIQGRFGEGGIRDWPWKGCCLRGDGGRHARCRDKDSEVMLRVCLGNSETSSGCL